MELIDYIVNVFVMVDDFCKIYYPSGKLQPDRDSCRATGTAVFYKNHICQRFVAFDEQDYS